MTRIAPLLLLLATAATAEARPPTCETSSAGFAQRQAEWATFTSKAFDAAIAREQLAIPKVTQRQLGPGDKLLAGVPVGGTFTIGSGADARVALYATRSQSYGAPQVVELVQDAQGVVHPLERKEDLTGSETHTLCGCGPMGGGAVAPVVAIIYVSPAGATYDATPIVVAYPAKHIDVRWRNVVDGKDVVCEPPP